MASRLRSVLVTESDEERSAFTLRFDAGRGGPGSALDDPMLDAPVGVGSRVVVVVTFGVLPQVLMDGIVTRQTLVTGDAPGTATLEVTGDDLSVLLDREERDAEWPALPDQVRALAILAPYAVHGIVPFAVPTPDSDPPLPIQRVPGQHDTDLRHLVELAAYHGYVAYMLPGPTVGLSTFYWGPPVRAGMPQPALSVDLGPTANVERAPRFRADGLAPVEVEGTVQDPSTGASVPIRSTASLRPALAALPLARKQPDLVRKDRLRLSGLGTTTAKARAQAQVDRSMDVVVGEGVLDGARYGGVLRPRGLVGVRGAGLTHDGLWYVQKVVHELARGSYRQSFTITREGFGSTVAVVRT